MTAVARFEVKLRRPLRGVRLHAVPRDLAASVPHVRKLLDLRADAEARAAADAATRESVSRCALAVESAIGQLPQIVGARFDEIAGVATELGLALARAVVGELVDARAVDVQQVVRRCLEEIADTPANRVVRIKASPDDLGVLNAAFVEMPDLAARARGAEFVADPHLGQGTVIVETTAGATFYDPRDAIERICNEVAENIT